MLKVTVSENTWNAVNGAGENTVNWGLFEGS
jgi:hypothetical protein